VFVEFLVSGRRRSGRSLQEIAGTTKIAPRHLEALERGRVDALPSGLYRRAIVRDYARCVGIDPEAALELLDRTFSTEAALPDVQALQGALSAAPSGVRAWPEAAALNATAARVFAKFRRTWVWPASAAVVLTIGGFVAAERRAPARGAESAIMAAALAEVERQDIRLPPDLRAAGTAGGLGGDGEGRDIRPEHQLVIMSQPEGARVTVDGIGWGVTPLTVRHLSAGEKVVRLTKDGYVAGERRVRLGGETGTAAVRLTLRPRG
jgi:hypothetical protein